MWVVLQVGGPFGVCKRVMFVGEGDPRLDLDVSESLIGGWTPYFPHLCCLRSLECTLAISQRCVMKVGVSGGVLFF